MFPALMSRWMMLAEWRNFMARRLLYRMTIMWFVLSFDFSLRSSRFFKLVPKYSMTMKMPNSSPSFSVSGTSRSRISGVQ